MANSKATGKARHPHDASRPESQAVLNALASGDIDQLELALSPRQRAFCHEYIVDFNGTAAAIRAGYSTNYPDRQAHNLLKNKGVAAYIDFLTRSKEAQIVSVNPDYVIQQVTAIITKEGTRDGDKLRALELLARHLGMFIDRTEISGKDGEAIKYQEIETEANDFTRKIMDIASRKKSSNGDSRKPDLKVVGD